jgi:hypothetical protein
VKYADACLPHLLIALYARRLFFLPVSNNVGPNIFLLLKELMRVAVCLGLRRDESSGKTTQRCCA